MKFYRDITEWQLDGASDETRERVLRQRAEREEREAGKSSYTRLVERQIARGNLLDPAKKARAAELNDRGRTPDSGRGPSSPSDALLLRQALAARKPR